MNKLVVVSGYFDPIHVGHLELIEKASKYGKVVVIVNNDDQAIIKKGKSFMPCNERLKIVRSLKNVHFAVKSIDEDRTVKKTLLCLQPDIFANGGDRIQDLRNIPEAKVCEENNIEMIDGLGDKIQSSSWLISLGNSISQITP